MQSFQGRCNKRSSGYQLVQVSLPKPIFDVDKLKIFYDGETDFTVGNSSCRRTKSYRRLQYFFLTLYVATKRIDKAFVWPKFHICPPTFFCFQKFAITEQSLHVTRRRSVVCFTRIASLSFGKKIGKFLEEQY